MKIRRCPCRRGDTLKRLVRRTISFLKGSHLGLKSESVFAEAADNLFL